jgi:hypothetical protein
MSSKPKLAQGLWCANLSTDNIAAQLSIIISQAIKERDLEICTVKAKSRKSEEVYPTKIISGVCLMTPPI